MIAPPPVSAPITSFAQGPHAVSAVASAGQWRRMVDFVYVVFSKGRPHKVDSVRSLVGSVFDQVHWLVTAGEKKAYEAAGARNVHEKGRINSCLSFAVKLGAAKQWPVAFFADDLQAFFCLQADAHRWISSKGRRVDLPTIAAAVLKEMRFVGAPLGGVYPKSSSREQLVWPAVSYRHYICMDFVVVDPPLRIDIPVEASPKEDYHLTASVLAASGAVARLNHYSIGAAHYQAGGAGTMAARADRDARAASWLIDRWNTSKEAVFRRASRDTLHHVSFSNAMALVKRCDVRLVDAHRALDKVLKRAVLGSKKQKSLVRKSQTARRRQAKRGKREPLARPGRPVAAEASAIQNVDEAKKRDRERKRVARGSLSHGSARPAGAQAKHRLVGPAAAAWRSALCRARANLKKLVQERRGQLR